jgi:hypothetical protein
MQNRRILLLAIALGFVSGFSVVAASSGALAPTPAYTDSE